MLYDEKYMPRGIPWEVNERESVFENLPVQGKLLLDVGAGTLRFSLDAIKRGARQVVALDVARGMLEWGIKKAKRLRREDRIDAVLSDARRLPFRNSIFGAVISMELFEHIPKDESLLVKEVHRVLETSGKAAISTWNKIPKLVGGYLGCTGKKTKYWKRGFFYRYYYPWEFKRLMLNAGFNKMKIVGGNSTNLIPCFWRMTSTELATAGKLVRFLIFLEIIIDKLFRKFSPLNQATGGFLLALLEK